MLTGWCQDSYSPLWELQFLIEKLEWVYIMELLSYCNYVGDLLGEDNCMFRKKVDNMEGVRRGLWHHICGYGYGY